MQKEAKKLTITIITIVTIAIILLTGGYLLHTYYSNNGCEETPTKSDETNTTKSALNETPTTNTTTTNQTRTNNTTTNQTTTITSREGGGSRGITTPICTDTCTSLGYECGNFTVCGTQKDCGTCDESFECDNGKCITHYLGNIKVLPSRVVNVGEEVFFDASAVIPNNALFLPNGLVKGLYEWDFGNTYTSNAGNLVTHFFTTPGDYNVTVNVTDEEGHSKKETIKINVVGNYKKLPPLVSTPPVLELKFEESITDSSGNNLKTTTKGNLIYTKGVEGKAADFSQGYIEVLNSTEINEMEEVTISFWAKKKKPEENNTILEKKDAFNYYIGVYNKNPGAIASFIKTTEGSAIPNSYIQPVNNELWHHYVLVYNKTHSMIFVDGRIGSDKTLIQFPLTGKINSSNNLYIGRGISSEETFNGYIDELKIYNISISQEDFTKKFELWHADFHARTSQYIYAQIPEGLRKEGNKIISTITGDNQYYEVLFEKTNLQEEEIFLLNNSKLPIGNYTLKVKITDSESKILEEDTESFEKPYEGIPKVGIDENNALVVDGKLFFPVTPFALRQDNYPFYNSTNLINLLHSESYYGSCDPPSIHGGPECHDANTWEDYLIHAQEYDWKVMGPGIWNIGPHPYRRILNLTDMILKISKTKNYESVFSWHLQDEPDINTEELHVPSVALRARTFIMHKQDPQHPVSVNYAGDNWLISQSRAKEYNYLQNTPYFGKKVFACDIYGLDYYPIDWATPTNRRARVSNLTTILDNMKKYNHNLIPFMSFVEITNIADDVGRNCSAVGTPGPTPEQIKMLAWLNVIHGAKGINWFNHFCPTPEENYEAMSEFLRQITELTPIVLGPETSINVTDNSNQIGNRVDILVREYKEDIYIFAARLTEIDDLGLTAESYDIITTFNIPGISEGIIEVYDENRQIPLIEGSFSDSFSPNEVHIYKITKTQDLQSNKLSTPSKIWDFIKKLFKGKNL